MFKIINTHENRFDKELVDPFLKELKAHHVDLLDAFPEHPKAAYILAKENPDRINGGALLVQRKEETLLPQIRECLDAFIPPNQEVWVGTIALEVKSGISGQDFQCFSKIFYRKLYESFITFGRQEKTTFLCLNLKPCEYLATDHLEYWPYMLTIRPKESKDG